MVKWIVGIIIFILIIYIEVIVINSFIQKQKYEKTHFPCTYISGKTCTVKPTWKNCSGGLPYDYCEKKINGFL